MAYKWFRYWMWKHIFSLLFSSINWYKPLKTINASCTDLKQEFLFIPYHLFLFFSLTFPLWYFYSNLTCGKYLHIWTQKIIKSYFLGLILSSVKVHCDYIQEKNLFYKKDRNRFNGTGNHGNVLQQKL